MSQHEQMPVTITTNQGQGLGGDTSGHGGGGGDDLMHRRRMQFIALLRGRVHWAIILAVVLGIMGAVGGYFSQGDRYSATAQIKVNPSLPNVGLFRDSRNGIPPMFRDYVDGQIEMLMSPQVMQISINSPQLRAAAPKGFTSEKLTDLINVRQSRSGYIFNVSAQSADRKLASAAVDSVVSSYLQVFRDKSSKQDAHKLSVLNNRKVDLNNQLQNLKQQRGAVAGALGAEGLAQRQSASLKRVERYEQMVDQLKMSMGPAPEDNAQPDYAHMSVAEMANRFPQMADLFNAQDQVRQQIEAYKAQGYGEQYIAVRRLSSRVGVLQGQIDRLADDIRAGLVTPVSPNSGSTDGSGRPMTRQQMALQVEQAKANLAQARAQSADLGSKLQKIHQIDDQIQRDKQSLNETLNALEKLTLERSVDGQITARVEQVGGVREPEDPSNGKTRIRLAVMGGFAGAVCGVGLVMGLGLLDRRLRHAADAEVGLSSARMLGILPTLPKNLANPDQAEKASHAVHHIRTMLQLGSQGSRADPPAPSPSRNGHNGHATGERSAWVYAVTSPAAGSGKSSLTTALGLSFAASDSRTLLIDADVVGAGLTSRLGAKVHRPLAELLQDRGLITADQAHEALDRAAADRRSLEDVLVDDMAVVSREDMDAVLDNRDDHVVGLMEACEAQRLEGFVAPTELHNLYILPVGRAQPRDAGSLSPTAFHNLIEKARREYDVVMIDTGPVLGSLEASLAITEADRTILIVSRGDEKAPAHRSLEMIQNLRAPLAGVVFNHATEVDLERSTYASMVSATRTLDRHVPNPQHTPEQSERFGPLGSAVASYGSVPRPMESPAPAATAATNGNGR